MDDYRVQGKRAKSPTLSVAVGNIDISATAVGNSSASVVLDGTAALESGALVQEGGAVDGEGTVSGVVLDDWGRGTAESAVEGLDVVARSEDAGEGSQHGEGDGVLHFEFVGVFNRHSLGYRK